MRLINADKIHPDVRTQHGALAISQGQLAYAEAVNAILIPEGATNGEIIQALFPNGAVAVMSYPSNKIGFITRDGNPDDNYVWYPTSWWNAKYKAESEGKG